MSKKKNRGGKVLLTPGINTHTLELSEADAGGKWMFRKKILPIAEINYPDKGGQRRRVVFDRAYHQKVIDAFKAKAYDAPTLQLADESNRHNMLPERAAGTVVDLSTEQPGDVDGPGLYATVRARNKKHARLLREMPTLGASAQIAENHERVDGAKFPAALRHVLVTAAPRVVGLGAWRAVSLSSDDTDSHRVIDLSTAEYEEIEMGKKNKDRGTAATTTDDAGTLSLSDDEIEAALEAAAAEFGDVDDYEPGGGLSLSDTDDPALLSLAATSDATRLELNGVQAKLAAAEWDKQRAMLSLAGVPKADLDVAGEVLAYPGESFVSLADEDGSTFDADARLVIRKLLELRKGTIDLSEVGGSGIPEPLEGDIDVDHAVDLWEKQSGIS